MTATALDMPWSLQDLARPVSAEDAPLAPEPGLRSVFFPGPDYRGKSTRVFAYIGLPSGASKDKPVPAMVLVHGGGGTALAYWVRYWNQRGYAAISMDTCGGVADGTCNGPHPRHEHSGPPGWGGFDQLDEPLTDQWCHHAVAAIVRGHTVIASLPEVDATRIGVTGISWGGYLTSIVAGVDHRFRFAVPVYGCGCLRSDSVWEPDFARLGEVRSAHWESLWDPRQYLPGVRIPMLFVNGTNDFAYPPSCWQQSHTLVPTPSTLSMRINLAHGHGGLGEKPGEIAAFADHHCLGTPALTRVTRVSVLNNAMSCDYEGDAVYAQAVFTEDACKWQDRRWLCTPAELDRKNRRVVFPRRGKAMFFNLTDSRGLVTSSPYTVPD